MNTEQVAWTVPADEYARFTDRVVERRGTVEKAGDELERAWVEFRDDHPLEAVADDLAAAVGVVTATAGQKEKTPATVPAVGDTETTRAWISVQCHVKEEMKQYADECGVPYHEVLRAVMSWYVGGGLVGRVTETLADAAPRVEDLAAVVAASDDVTTPETVDIDPDADVADLRVTERRTVEIAARLGDVFSEADLRDAIAAVAGASKPTIRDYTERVTDYTGVRRWEYDDGDDRPDMFFPPETYREKRAGEIIDALGGDAVADTGPTDAEGDPVGFDAEAFARACHECGIEVSGANETAVVEYRERVLARLDYAKSEYHEAFVPAATARAAPNQTDASGDASADTGTDADADAGRVSDTRAEVEAEAAALMNATPARVRTDGGRDVTVVADVGRATLPPETDVTAVHGGGKGL